MKILVAVELGASLFSFNMMSFIQLANTMEEIMIFQLINSEPNYPENVNELLNTADLFNFKFLSNPFENILYSSFLFKNIWLDNNIRNHNSLEYPSFLFNFMLIFP